MSTACNLHLKVSDHLAGFYESALCDPTALEKDQFESVLFCAIMCVKIPNAGHETSKKKPK